MAKLSVREKLVYGVGAFGYGAVNQTFGNFLMFFGTAFLGLSGTLMGLAISVSTVWDAVTDPIVGTMCDRYRGGRMGRRQTFMLAGAIGIAIINIAIWSVPRGWSEPAKFFAMLVALLAVETFNTVYSTPYSALGIDMASNYNDRTGIQSYKTAFAFSSLLVPSLLIALGYIWISVITSVLCIATALITIHGTKNYRGFSAGSAVAALPFCSPSVPDTRPACMGAFTQDTQDPAFGGQGKWSCCKTPKRGRLALDSGGHFETSPPKTEISAEGRGGQGGEGTPHPLGTSAFADFFAGFFAVVRLKNVGMLMLAYTVSLLCSAVITALGMHVFTYSFHFTAFQIPIVMLCLIAGVVAGQPLWCAVAARIDKKNTVLCAIYVILVGIVLFSTLLAVRAFLPRAVLLLLVCITIIIVAGGIGCLATLPISMFADCIYLSAQQSAASNTATAMGFLTLCTKLSNAFIMFFVGVVLDAIGFAGGGGAQTPFVSNALGVVLVAGVGLSCVISYVFYSKYTYTKKDVTLSL